MSKPPNKGEVYFHPAMLEGDVRLDHLAPGGKPFFIAGVVVAKGHGTSRVGRLQGQHGWCLEPTLRCLDWKARVNRRRHVRRTHPGSKDVEDATSVAR